MQTFKKHFPLGLFAGSIVVLWTLIVGQRTTEARAFLNERLAEQRDNLSRLHTRLDALRARQATFRELDQRCAEFQRQLPASETCDATIAAVKQLADVNTLTLLPVRSLASPPTIGMVKRSFRLQARGSFNAFYSFLTQLEASTPSLMLSDLQLRRLGDGESDLAADITLHLLFRPDADTTPKPIEISGSAQ